MINHWVTAGVLAVALLASTGGAAQAQGADSDEAGVFDGAAEESEAPGEDLSRKIRALRWGVAASAVATPLGAGLFIGGAAACTGNQIFGQNCSTGENAAFGVGIALMAAGTAGMIASAVLLRRRKQERTGLRASRRLHWSHTSGSFVF